MAFSEYPCFLSASLKGSGDFIYTFGMEIQLKKIIYLKSVVVVVFNTSTGKRLLIQKQRNRNIRLFLVQSQFANWS